MSSCQARNAGGIVSTQVWSDDLRARVRGLKPFANPGDPEIAVGFPVVTAAGHFGEIVTRFQDMAWGYAYAILKDHYLAEDVAQEALIRFLWDSGDF